jgi:hypothetical protein
MQTKVTDPRAILDEEPIVAGNTASFDLSKAEPDEEEEEEDDDGEEAMKSLPTEDDLLKSLEALSAASHAAESGVSLRQTQLAARAATGADLSKSEKEELARFLTDEEDAYMYKSHASEFASDPTVAQGMEISDFLEAQTMVLAKSLDDIAGAVHSGQAENDAFNAVLAKSVSAMGGTIARQARQIADLENMIKSLAGVAAAQPRAPKGMTRPSRVGQPFGENMAKSQNAPGTPPASIGDLTKSDILDTLDDLVEKGGSADGIDFVHETAMLESTGVISPRALKAVLKHRGVAA